jgi:sodium bicarbonate cotransporter 7
MRVHDLSGWVVRKEHKLVKGGGYHLDLLVVALSILLNSLLGIPWYVASTILSITHVRSLNRESGMHIIKGMFINPLC